VIDAPLAPGDSLYIPEGFPHSASAQEQASVHVTIGILAVTWADVLKEAVRAIEDDPELRRPLPLGFATDDGALTVEVRRRLDGISASIRALDAEDLARRMRHKVLTTRQPVLRGQIHRLLALDRTSDDSLVRRREGSICVLEMIDGQFSVLLGDRQLQMPRWLEPAMALVAEGGVCSVSDLPGLDEAGRIVLARRLIREGLLEVVD
jgi:hypothetical protein